MLSRVVFIVIAAITVHLASAQPAPPDTSPAEGSGDAIQPIDPDPPSAGSGSAGAGSAAGSASAGSATGGVGSGSAGSGNVIKEAATPAMTVDDVVIDASRLRFGILMFGDVSASAQYPIKPSTSFSIGALGMRLTANLGNHAEALGELAFEDGRVDVEQFVIGYRTPKWSLHVGRLHTELGYWNTAYHHGFWLQPLVKRPHPIRFEDDGGLAPVHWVGLHAQRHIALDHDELVLIGGIGNGRGTIVDDVLINGDLNQAKAVLLKVAYRHRGPTRYDFGVSTILDRIPPAPTTVRPDFPGSIDELVANAYAFYRGPQLSLHAEGFAFVHGAGGKTHVTTTAFALIGYRAAERLTVFAGADLLFVDEADPFFIPDARAPVLTDLTELIGSLRYDLGTWDALKLEGHADLIPNEDPRFTFTLNWSFGI